MDTQDSGIVQIALTRLTLELPRSDREEAERHLAELRTHHPARPAEARPPSTPASRHGESGRGAQRERLSVAWEWMRREVQSPSTPIGWRVAHLRLLKRPTLGRVTIMTLLFLATVVLVGSVSRSSAAQTYSALFFAGTLAAAIKETWGDMVRLPFHSARLRRRIVKSPWCVLPTTAGARRQMLMGREEASPMVPRRELYDELLPGILDRSRRDIQMVVGDPGSGKTTALVGISRLLAKIGFVPVVVQLGSDVSQVDVVELARERFKRHARGLLGSDACIGEVWEWLREHRRVVTLVDDMDRIAPDGERGFMVRQGLNELAAEGLPAVVTARPAGIPAGLAASAISLVSLDERDAVANVLRTARDEHGAAIQALERPEVRGNVALWIRQGKFTEVPFYLDLLARLVAADRCEDLAPPETLVNDVVGDHRIRLKPDGRCEWNPLWVRFRLLERFYREVAEGRVRRWLGIERQERERCLEALSESALSTLAASALSTLPDYKLEKAAEGEEGQATSKVAIRTDIERFLDTDDRRDYRSELGERRSISAHEVVETGERLCFLDRDPNGTLVFRHRILQAYLAGRSLAEKLPGLRLDGVGDGAADGGWYEEQPLDWIGALLDPRHPDRLTARMAITFAAIWQWANATDKSRADDAGDALGLGRLLARMVAEAGNRADGPDQAPAVGDADREERRAQRLDPRKPFDPEAGRIDPDDSLSILTAAAEIASATGHLDTVLPVRGGQLDSARAILMGIQNASGATRWTKINAIPVIAGLSAGVRGDDGRGSEPALREKEQWTRIWEFARDPDEAVRREASTAMADDAWSAYRALEPGVEALLIQAALKSARDLPLDRVTGSGGGRPPELVGSQGLEARLYEYGLRDEKRQVDSLCALGWVMPAIVSGLREQPASMVARGFGDPEGRRDGGRPAQGAADRYAEVADRARQALETLVTLAFQRRFADLEAAVARGFKSDAMRHADDPEQGRGPGFVDSNRQLVSDIAIDNVHYWYARLVLHQALALYTIAGSSPRVALDTYSRFLRPGGRGEPHPFVRQAALQARRAVWRSAIGSRRWDACIWGDEQDAVSRRQASMNPATAQLVGDLTLLLNLRENASQDSRTQSSRTSRLPFCLSGSRDRLEILGGGCSKACGFGLCPLVEAPVDEPDGKRTVSRAFCRGQQQLTKHHRPAWQAGISRAALKDFWIEMERRART